MRCTACGYDSPSGKKFCGECGAPQNRRCPSCGGEIPPETNFCGDCGTPLAETAKQVAPRSLTLASYTPKHLAEKILRSRSALQGERKQVTVLFADVMGSMDLGESVEAEEWHGIMEGFFRILSDDVHRYEGTINQYTGDGIMALFGAPIAHEDRAQRACFSAVSLKENLHRYAEELRSEKDIDFSVRSASTSGRSWSGGSGMICGWTTRRSGTRRASGHGWSRSPGPGRST
jgi:Double zinc ribbon